MTQVFDAALRPTGLRATQFSLLATLAKGGDAPLTRLAQTLVMDRTTLTRNLKPLLRRELIRIEQQDDQRIRNVSLTDAGKRAFKDALPRWEQVQIRISAELGQERWSGFLEDLAATVSAVRDG